MVLAVGVDSLTLAPAPTQACAGDSGGPVLAAGGGGEVLVGLVLGGSSSCTDTATALRIDTYADSFIAPVVTGAAVSGAPPAPQPGGTGCSAAPRRPPAPSFVVTVLCGAAALVRGMRRRAGTTRRRAP